jgi:hypothetical protein
MDHGRRHIEPLTGIYLIAVGGRNQGSNHCFAHVWPLHFQRGRMTLADDPVQGNG